LDKKPIPWLSIDEHDDGTAMFKIDDELRAIREGASRVPSLTAGRYAIGCATRKQITQKRREN
jgi:hypothetical protein